jgi:8-oxo-dGTP pyrophosphatase MutT (NUDIX family)
MRRSGARCVRRRGWRSRRADPSSSRSAGPRSCTAIFLVYECRVAPGPLRLNAEFDAAEWVAPARLSEYDRNTETVDTFARLGL